MTIEAKSLDNLYSKHETPIRLLKEVVEKNYPDLKTKNTLKDGTQVDNLFYLRYVLSSKTPLDTLSQVEDSKTLKDVFECLKWRKEMKEYSSKDEMNLVKIIPFLRTGELTNGFPVVYLPVKDVAMDLISKNQGNKKFETELMDNLLFHKSSIFHELDSKSRKQGKLVKSIVIYDLNGLSFSDVYRLSGFFKMVGAQGKVFKKLFPQNTQLTVILNSPAAGFLKKFLTSSKQKIMAAKEMYKVLGSKECLPTQVGGSFVWPTTEEEWRSVIAGNSLNRAEPVKDIEMRPIERQESVNVSSSEGSVSVQSRKNPNKIILNSLEREMVHMKKNKLFSIDVLAYDQKVNLFFTNARKKNANILVVIKEEGQTFTNAAVLPPGLGSLTLDIRTKGEVLLVYLDTKMATTFNANLEDINLKRHPAKRVARYTKKKIGLGVQGIKGLDSMTKYRKKNKLDEIMDVSAINEMRRQHDLRAVRLSQLDKVLFRFEVTDSVVCGDLDGHKTVKKEEVREFAKGTPSAPFETSSEPERERELVDFDGQSLRSMDSVSTAKPSFFFTAANILTRGW